MRWAWLAALTFVACSDDGADGPHAVTPAPVGAPWKTLGEWHLFVDVTTQAPSDGVHAYNVTSPLYSDYASKHRFFWLPDGTTIAYHADTIWKLPVGAIAVKTFAYPIDARDPSKGERLLETRLLVHEPSGWVPHTYVYEADGKTATRKVAGAIIPVSWIDASGAVRTNDYVVPNTNECQECHAKAPDTELLGLKTAQLEGLPRVDGKSLVDVFAAEGLFDVAPGAERLAYHAPDDTSASLSDRARAYLDANCAHCHNPAGDASSKALYLDWAHTDPATNPSVNWGTCKVPTSAGGATCGYAFDVVPGDAEHSIMICRMMATRGEFQMPPIGRRLVHDEGIALIRAWIDSAEQDGCL